MQVPPVQASDEFGKGAAASAAGHAVLFGLAYYLMVVRVPAVTTVELDLTRTPRVPATPAHPAPPRPKGPTWTAPTHGLAPSPTSATEAPEPEAVATCPPPCPDHPGDFIPAAQASAKPRWIAGFITDDDYPRVARQQGQDGMVTLSVFIDAAGNVRDVRLLRGSYAPLNQVALDKVKTAKFQPARDDAGRPIPVKLILPIRFELK